jgi:hypothetical protein
MSKDKIVTTANAWTRVWLSTSLVERWLSKRLTYVTEIAKRFKITSPVFTACFQIELLAPVSAHCHRVLLSNLTLERREQQSSWRTTASKFCPGRKNDSFQCSCAHLLSLSPYRGRPKFAEEILKNHRTYYAYQTILLEKLVLRITSLIKTMVSERPKTEVSSRYFIRHGCYRLSQRTNC